MGLGQDVWYTTQQSDENQQPIRTVRTIRHESNNKPKKQVHMNNSNRNGYKNNNKSYTYSTTNFGLIN